MTDPSLTPAQAELARIIRAASYSQLDTSTLHALAALLAKDPPDPQLNVDPAAAATLRRDIADELARRHVGPELTGGGSDRGYALKRTLCCE